MAHFWNLVLSGTLYEVITDYQKSSRRRWYNRQAQLQQMAIFHILYQADVSDSRFIDKAAEMVANRSCSSEINAQ
ncbi:uncharacterized protein ASCRUDRAFT_83012 [Ascoidea rubescens DSM 1968]|uniref:Uncharacterized protein n=1 Tax=Ascoidea rubescens DSM 1968 TaxID=1344418 RepID=A0A1D2V9I5_9ASCO|nr:hypothetical protein ASCRUDRAFT_83012 [Ascoidea rubescens DSM 1968]ODV58239.1 hypothetical protein ASCRUDRAFT_83012 [Ascoidea rubescens DSM 1968]